MDVAVAGYRALQGCLHVSVYPAWVIVPSTHSTILGGGCPKGGTRRWENRGREHQVRSTCESEAEASLWGENSSDDELSSRTHGNRCCVPCEGM